MKESFNDLKETVIEAIKSMLITQVIEAGIKWLLSLLIPGAGFIKAIMAIKDIIVFFVESAVMLIPAITEAILALAAGSIAGVGKAIVPIAIGIGFAKLLPLVIGLFAKLIGLGGLSKRVMKIFKKIRKRVDKAVNKLLKKAKKAGRKLMRKLGIGKKKKKKKGDKDERSDAEMKADLNKGIGEATTFVKQGGHDKKEIKKQLDKIETKYDFVELKLVVDKVNPEGKDKFHIHGKVNPEADGDGGEAELDQGELSPELLDLVTKLKPLPGADGLTGYIESKKIKPWFKHGFITQAERALYYHDKSLLVDIEQRFQDPKTGKLSRFDLVIKDTDANGVDNGKEVVVEVKNWTGFAKLDVETQTKRLGSLQSQLMKYKASTKQVLLEWKGVIPEKVIKLCKRLKVTVKSI